MKKDNRTWVNVKSAELCIAAGNSILNPNLPMGNTWELTLSDGQIVSRHVRYSPPEKGVRYGRGWYRRRHYDDALPPPKRVLVSAPPDAFGQEN